MGADSGSSKYGKAKELKTPLIDEEGLFALILASAPFAAAPKAAAAPAPISAPAPVAPVARAPLPRPEIGQAPGACPSRPPAGAPSSCIHVVRRLGTEMCNSCAGPVLNQLWVEKHKPLSVAQLVGNGKLISDLRGWLNEWQRCDLDEQRAQEQATDDLFLPARTWAKPRRPR